MRHEPRLPEGLPNPWLLDCEVFSEAIRPDPDLTISQWADANRVLTAESSAEPGPWRTDRVPHAREIMDALSPGDPTPEVTFVAGTQVTKTEIGNNFVGFNMDVGGGPGMMVLPTSATGKRNSKTRLSKMIDSTPSLRAKVSDQARDGANSASLKVFPGGILVIAGSNSAAELKSTPVRWLFEDEVDEYPDDVDGQGPADELAEKRTDTYQLRKKIYRASSCTDRRSKIWKHYQRSDRRKRWVPCPHCNAEQVLKWDQFRWETHKRWESTDVETGEVTEVAEGTEGAKARDTGELLDVWYECEHCRVRIDEHHKSYMLPLGRWIPERPEVKNHKGYHLPAFYSPLGWFSWRQVVEARLLADKDPTKSRLKLWTNTVAAEPYIDTGESISDLILKERPKQYRLGTVPRFALLLTGSVDVQGNRLEVAIKGWGRDKESCLVDYQVIFGDTENAGPTGPWAALDEYRKRKFPHESGAELRVTAMAVDAGYRTQVVYDYCRPRISHHVFPVRGQAQSGKTVLGRPTKQDIDHNGKKIPNGIDLWPVGADTAKHEIYARLKIEIPGPGYMHFPEGLPDEYFRGLVAEHFITKYVKGYLKGAWEKEDTERNEPLDLEVYAYAAAIYAGLNRINWDRLEASLLATAQDLFVAAQRDEQQKEEGSGATAEAPPAVETAQPEPKAPAAPEARSQWLPRRDNWLRR